MTQGRTVKINPSNKSTTIFAFDISGTDGKDYFKTDGGWYQSRSFMQAGSLYLQKFDLTSGEWISVNLADNNSSSATAFCENGGKIYFSANKEVYYYENAGTNRLKSVKYISLDDIEITDDIPMSKMSDMLFDDDGNVLFADEEHGLVRKITKK